MAYVLKTIGNAVNILYKNFECDNVSDLATIDTSDAPMGSTCYVINTDTLYTLNSNKEWKIRSLGTNSGGGNITPPSSGDNYIYDGGEEA